MGQKDTFILNDREYCVEIISLKPDLVLSINGSNYLVNKVSDDNSYYSTLDLNETRYSAAALSLENSAHVKLNGKSYFLYKKLIQSSRKTENGRDNLIIAAMPGTIVDVYYKENEPVNEGDVILATESMKMQTNIIAPRDGIIEKINFNKNETFEKGSALILLQEVPDDKN